MIPNTTLKFQRFCLITLMLVAVSLVVFTYSDVIAYYGAKYTESAHGDSTSGVNRSTLSGYSIGNCAHCHEQHASIEGSSHTAYDFELFAANNPTSQTANFCFQCHKDGSVQNDTYSKNFGGGTADSDFNSIYEAFNPPTGATKSSHNLADVQSHAIGRSIGFTSNTNACVVCHDPHTAQDNHPVTASGHGGVYSALRRPLDYFGTDSAGEPRNVWGDDDSTGGYNERMIDYTAKYTAPYYKGGTNHEPANNTTDDGSNLPNFYNFCVNNCHTRSGVSSTEHGTLTQIDWSTTGDMHGKHHDSSSGWGYTIAPYGSESTNYVMACTDCHEPHGSENEWLLRTCVNGKDNISVTSSGWWMDFCTACHVITMGGGWHQSGTQKCSNCHTHSWSVGYF